MSLLCVRDLHAKTDSSEILHGLDLEIGPGEIHALMGPNGAGKSTLTHVLAGGAGYEVTSGSVEFGGDSLLGLPTYERARLGLFVAFQYPVEIPGVRLKEFLTLAADARDVPVSSVSGDALDNVAQRLDLAHTVDRNVNEDLSGGEKKRSETLQIALLGARLAVLDEIDSGLDVDGIRKVSAEILRKVDETGMSVLIITHYVRIWRYLPAQFTHVLVDGRIVRSGGPEIAEELEACGYEQYREHDDSPDEKPSIFDL